MSQPREYSLEECRELFLQELGSIADYCLKESRKETVKEKIDLAIFAVLSLIDGEHGAFPTFALVPTPNSDDVDYYRRNNCKRWPAAVNISDGDLHHKWWQRRSSEE